MTERATRTPPTHLTAAEAAGLVTSGMWLDYGFGICQPDVFDAALAARVPNSGASRSAAASPCARAPFRADPDRGTHPQPELALQQRLRPAPARRGPLHLHPPQPGRVARPLPPLHRARGHRGHRVLPEGCGRLLQLLRRGLLPPGPGQQGRYRHPRGQPRPALVPRPGERGARKRGGFRDRRRRRARGRVAQRRPRPRPTSPSPAKSSPTRSPTATACRSASAACPTRSAGRWRKPACAIWACIPR